jgi:hypothetical protein
MPELTRRRYPEAREECWHVYYSDVHAGTIAKRIGIPFDEDPWGWSCGFYPGSHPGECTNGVAATFDQARADFEAAWRVFLSSNGGRFSGVARPAGLDRPEICHVASRREVAVAETQFPDDLPLRRSV